MKAIGIDLGTTNTVIAHDERVLEIQTEDGVESRLRSAVAFLPSGRVLVGEAARARRLMDPENSIVASKRILSAKERDPVVGDYRNRYRSRIDRDEARLAVFKTRAGLKAPREISAIIVEAAVRRAGLKPEECAAVITVPAAFSERQREDTLWAGRTAGLAEVELLDEPVATALAHGKAAGAKHAAIYDIGGGTFDFCVLDCALWPVGMLNHGGDLFLGGDDFDEAIAANVAARLLETLEWDVRSEEEVFQRLLVESERLKRELRDQPMELPLSALDPGLPSTRYVHLDPKMITEACYAIVRRTFRTCERVLDELDLSPLSMDLLFLAGGGSELPLVRNWVVTFFGVEPSPGIRPFEAIARGASLAARERFGA